MAGGAETGGGAEAGRGAGGTPAGSALSSGTNRTEARTAGTPARSIGQGAAGTPSGTCFSAGRTGLPFDGQSGDRGGPPNVHQAC